ncbi:hypothetical protein NADFUDRAFT_46706 [Nadsonia fulvescens var. elongata DSM 6958]|uniref:Nucleoporin Nup82 n=1 Tax=Nadsonia fulvescens var. elongata DSM 6958 TaxID=857566 RepID=A0A1E3PJ39_9ASCO|nr:hypothetical protein NADFUDRAFT_46706 [Nadsonia fulvescens var. elongata DSM 6958]
MSDSTFIDKVTANRVFALGDDGLLASPQQSGSLSNNRIATRRNEVFITDGNSVRWAEIGTDGQTSMTSYKLLDLSSVNFIIEALEINQTGTKLAIIGSAEIAVCVLPSHNNISSSKSSIAVKSHKVGAHLLSETSTTRLLKVIWNPTGRYDSNLITLMSDAVIRSFDLCINYEQPEFSYDLSTLGCNGSNVGASFSTNTIIDPVSITFGASSDIMGLITLYVLSSDGDIYSLCPWMPSQAVLSRESIEQMFDFAVSMEQEARQSNISNNNNPQRRRYLRQLDWVSRLWNQIPLAIAETRFSLINSSVVEELLIVKKPALFSNIAPAGPYTVSPFPDVLYEGEAVDFSSVDIGAMSGLIVAYSNGLIATLLSDNSTITYFADDANIDRNTDEVSPETLSLVESIQLPLQHSLIYQNPQVPFSFFVVTETTIFKVDYAAWAVPFSDAVNQGDIEMVESILESGIVSTVSEVNRSPHGFPGRAIITDKSGLPYLLTYDGQDASLVLALDESRIFNRTNISTVDEKVETIESVAYESLLAQPYADIERVLLGNVKTSPPQQLLGSISLNEQMKCDGPSLNQFSAIVNFYGDQISMVHRVSFWIHNRMSLQVTEYRRQMKKVKEFEEKLKDLSSQNQQLELLQVALDRQRRLSQRADILLAKLSSKYALPLSENEKKWFDEVNRVQSKLNDKQGLQIRVESALEQGQTILSKAKNILEDKANDNNNDTSGIEKDTVINSSGSLRLTQDKIDRLKDLLFSENQLVENTKTLLTNMINVTTQELAQLCV